MNKLISLLAVSFFVFILWIIYLANTGGNSIFFELVKTIPFGDKLGHFILFGLLTLGANAALKFKAFKLGSLSIYTGTLLVTLFVIGEELSQAFISSRTFDLKDLAADGVGIIAFTVASSFLAKKFYAETSL